jgi:hypothetical protein
LPNILRWQGSIEINGIVSIEVVRKLGDTLKSALDVGFFTEISFKSHKFFFVFWGALTYRLSAQNLAGLG